MNFFSDTEMQCKCGCGNGPMDPEFMLQLNFARYIAGIPFLVTSGYRCPTHNLSKEVGGKTNSSHLIGVAADIAAQADQTRHIVFSALIRAGFRRIGIHKTFIHVDTDPQKNQDRIWVY